MWHRLRDVLLCHTLYVRLLFFLFSTIKNFNIFFYPRTHSSSPLRFFYGNLGAAVTVLRRRQVIMKGKTKDGRRKKVFSSFSFIQCVWRKCNDEDARANKVISTDTERRWNISHMWKKEKILCYCWDTKLQRMAIIIWLSEVKWSET